MEQNVCGAEWTTIWSTKVVEESMLPLGKTQYAVPSCVFPGQNYNNLPFFSFLYVSPVT
jgi:hypothetical protein